MVRGIVVVAAAGEGDAAFPGAMDGVIAVSTEDPGRPAAALGAQPEVDACAALAAVRADVTCAARNRVTRSL